MTNVSDEVSTKPVVSNRARINLASALVIVGHCASESEAKRLIQGGGTYVNDQKAAENQSVSAGDKISAGKRRHAVLRFERDIRADEVRHHAGQSGDERAAVVAWLRHQSDLGANRANEADKGTTKRAAFGGGSLALHRAADAIEAGEHLTNDNATPASDSPNLTPDEQRAIEIGREMDAEEASDSPAISGATKRMAKTLGADFVGKDSPAPPDCPSCHGLNTSCPDGCGRDPETGELDGSRLEPTPASHTAPLTLPGESEAHLSGYTALTEAIDKLSGIASPSAGVLRVDQAEALRTVIDAALNPPKNNIPDKTLVERLRNVNDWLSAHYDDEAEEHGCAIDDAIIALSQPQHGGLVAANFFDLACDTLQELERASDIPGSRVHILEQAMLRAALASNSPVVGEDVSTIPAGMKPWSGGDSAPKDWDGGPVLCADGDILTDDCDPDDWDWNNEHGDPNERIIAYTPKPTPAPSREG